MGEAASQIYSAMQEELQEPLPLYYYHVPLLQPTLHPVRQNSKLPRKSDVKTQPVTHLPISLPQIIKICAIRVLEGALSCLWLPDLTPPPPPPSISRRRALTHFPAHSQSVCGAHSG